jgi:hypothetical protein
MGLGSAGLFLLVFCDCQRVQVILHGSSVGVLVTPNFFADIKSPFGKPDVEARIAKAYGQFVCPILCARLWLRKTSNLKWRAGMLFGLQGCGRNIPFVAPLALRDGLRRKERIS